jgi:type IV secretion system protein TrbD
MEEIRRITIHRALNRPNLIAGVDRELALLVGLLTVALIMVVQTLWSLALGLSLWVFGFYILRRLAKEDPLMRPIFIRYQIYAKYYPAQAKYCGRIRDVPTFWQK